MKARPEQGQIVLIMLRAINDLEAGKQTLVPFLHGSRSKEMLRRKMHKQQGYGALFWKPQAAIADYLDQLREMELITAHRLSGPHWSYYVLVLTLAGEKVLNDNLPIALQDRPVVDAPIGDTIEETLRLLKQGHSPEAIAQVRNLKLSTIYTHLHGLVATGAASAREFISDETIGLVLEAKRKQPFVRSLSEFKALLPERITYEEIRCVLSDTLLRESTQ
jgi:uncharacterized protein YpbB